MELDELKRNLASTKKEHEHDKLFTGELSISDMISDVLSAIAELEQEIQHRKANLESINFKLCEKDAKIADLEAKLTELGEKYRECSECRDNAIIERNTLNRRISDLELNQVKWFDAKFNLPSHIKYQVKLDDGTIRNAEYYSGVWWVENPEKGVMDMVSPDSGKICKWFPSLPPCESK